MAQSHSYTVGEIDALIGPVLNIDTADVQFAVIAGVGSNGRLLWRAKGCPHTIVAMLTTLLNEIACEFPCEEDDQ